MKSNKLFLIRCTDKCLIAKGEGLFEQNIPLYWNNTSKDWSLMSFGDIFDESEIVDFELPENGKWVEWIQDANSW